MSGAEKRKQQMEVDGKRGLAWAGTINAGQKKHTLTSLEKHVQKKKLVWKIGIESEFCFNSSFFSFFFLRSDKKPFQYTTRVLRVINVLIQKS